MPIRCLGFPSAFPPADLAFAATAYTDNAAHSSPRAVGLDAAAKTARHAVSASHLLIDRSGQSAVSIAQPVSKGSVDVLPCRCFPRRRRSNLWQFAIENRQIFL